MDIILEGEALRMALGSKREATKRWGAGCAARLCQRLMEIKAASSVQVLGTLPGLQLAAEAGTDRFVLSLGPDYVLRCEAIEAEPNSEVGSDGTKAVLMKVRILAVEARHGD